ncbi:MAG TPA: DUF262 domain-containing protein [Micromonosporaceae bacterium]|nr:DUF262 domain-containing protein [Micromonosporaceae bacterium]
MPGLARPRVEYRTPEDLVQEVTNGYVRIPPFQRGFKWEAADVVKLFDSLHQGFPIGNLLLWSRPAPAQHLRVGPLEINAPDTEAALWVVDGQQRITSLVGALVAGDSSSDSRFRVHLDLDTGEFHTTGLRQDRPSSWVPVSLLLDTRTLLRWMRENAGWLADPQIALADQAAKAIREYQIPTYVVSATDEEPLLEIFTRMNTTGKPLTKSEVFHALHSGMAGDEPLDLHSLGRTTADLGFGPLDDRLAMRCILAVRGGDIFREDFHDEFVSDEDRADTFREVASALREVAHFLRSECGIPHVKLLPYSHPMPVLVRFVRLHGVPGGRVSTLLRRWVWRGAIAGTRARGLSVGEIRNQVLAVEQPTPMAAAQQLLGHVPSYLGFVAELDKTHFNHAMTKISTLGLLSVDPVDLMTGHTVDIARLMASGSPLRTVINDGQTASARTIANRVIGSTGSGQLLRQRLAQATPEAAASHLVDAEGQELLLSGDLEAFLIRRGVTCEKTIRMHVERMAEWGARDGRSIADTIRSAA